MTAGPDPRAILTLDRLVLNRGPRQILKGVSLTVDRGDLVALMGPSGSGKTTILRALAGLEAFQAGRIVVDDLELRGGEMWTRSVLAQLRRKVGMVFQFHCLFEHLTALQNVCLAPVHALKVAPGQAERRARELLSAFGVDHRADAWPRELSGGEAQRVAIARALAVEPPVLLMDEPTASLDPDRRGELGTLLRRLTSQGRTLLIATHDEDFAQEFATRVVRMGDGIVVDGLHSFLAKP
jgi:ABC-type polar amino acid transport system ATPase subunit